MASLRRRLRLCATTWLVFQVAWLSALVPRDCCAAHEPSHKADHGCNPSAAAAYCPMRAADGTPCPMHRGQDHQPEHARGSAGEPYRPPSSGCWLRGGCDGPMAAFMTLLSNHGILPSSAVALPAAEVRSLTAIVDESVVSRFQPPDPPPPRA